MEAGPFMPGFRCPDLQLARNHGDSSRLYQVFDYRSFSVLQVNRRQIDIPEVATPFCRIWALVLNGARDEKNKIRHEVDTGTTSKMLYLNSVELPDWVNAMVIRPDMYVGYVGKEAGEYLAGIFEINTPQIQCV
jgi:phenol 2-monooxygenase (NADPH)